MGEGKSMFESRIFRCGYVPIRKYQQRVIIDTLEARHADQNCHFPPLKTEVHFLSRPEMPKRDSDSRAPTDSTTVDPAPVHSPT